MSGKSQKHGHHKGQIDYTAHKGWHGGLPDRLNFTNRLCMVPLHMSSPPALLTLQSMQVSCIALAYAYRPFERMLQKGAEFQVLRFCFSCAVCGHIELCQSPSESLGAIPYFKLLQISYFFTHQIRS